jgi:glycosyltransferase involved in cell wall biosynthesis
MMRIAIVTENFLPKLDGVTRTLAVLLEYLHARQHQVLVLGPESGMEEYAGAEVIGTAGVPLPFYPELRVNFFRPLFVRRLKEFDPEVVHLVDPVVLGAAGLVAARLLKKPVVSSYHTNLALYCQYFGFAPFTGLMWRYTRFIHNHCDLTLCPSPSTARMLQAQGFQHVRLWPRGVDTTLFSPARRSAALRSSWLQQGGEREQLEDKVVLLYVGRLSWEKNLRLLVEAYRELDYRRCHLVIVGDGPAAGDMRQALAGLPASFTGYLRGEELATAYASADIFVFPSCTETFGQVVLEAMACGLPVVALDTEGICDLVLDGRTGLLDRRRSSQEEQIASYGAQLNRLIQDPARRQQMGRAALREAPQRSWPFAMDCLMHGYQEVAEGAHPAVAA